MGVLGKRGLGERGLGVYSCDGGMCGSVGEEGVVGKGIGPCTLGWGCGWDCWGRGGLGKGDWVTTFIKDLE